MKKDEEIGGPFIGGLIQLVITIVIVISIFSVGRYVFPKQQTKIEYKELYITQEEKDCKDKGGVMNYYTNNYDEYNKIYSWKCVVPEKVLETNNFK